MLAPLLLFVFKNLLFGCGVIMKRHSFAVKISEHLLPLPKISFCTYRKYRPVYYEASSLLDLSSCVVDAQPGDCFWYWAPEEVAEWIAKKLFHPEFRETILKNEINGKALLLLEIDKFPKINIRDFNTLKELSAQIRKLCHLDKEEFKRSISLPPRKPFPLYLRYKASHTGPSSYFTTPSQYFKKINLIREEVGDKKKNSLLLNHWNRISPIFGEKYLNPLVGNSRKRNIRPKEHPYLLGDLCKYRLPCED